MIRLRDSDYSCDGQNDNRVNTGVGPYLSKEEKRGEATENGKGVG